MQYMALSLLACPNVTKACAPARAMCDMPSTLALLYNGLCTTRHSLAQLLCWSSGRHSGVVDTMNNLWGRGHISEQPLPASYEKLPHRTAVMYIHVYIVILCTFYAASMQLHGNGANRLMECRSG